MINNSIYASADDKETNSPSVLEKLIDLSTDDLLHDDATSLSIGKAIEILTNEKNRLGKIEEARRIATEIAEKRHRDEINKITSMDLPLDWENLFHNSARTEGIHAESPSNALLLSLNNLGKIDIEYMAEISDSNPKTVILALKGSILQNPETWEKCWYQGWETREEYLSGNLIRKRKVAVEANKKFDGYFQEDIIAIDTAKP